MNFLKRMDLSLIPRQSQASFDRWLDDQTDRLRRELPGRAGPWGVARKALNLFLRSCVYNHYLRGKHCLDRIEGLLEIPLDSKVANGLREKDKKGLLPPWRGLKRLSPRENPRYHEVSDTFQQHAAVLAKKMGLPARVFLDNYLFLENR